MTKKHIQDKNIKISITGYSFVDTPSQIFICGVNDSGCSTFTTIFFSEKTKKQSTFRIANKVTQLLFIVILDGLHTQNIEEEKLFKNIIDICKAKQKCDIDLLLVLNKTDLFYNKRKTPHLVDDIFESYKLFFAREPVNIIGFIPFSCLATNLFHRFISKEIDDDDCDDARALLIRIGRHLPAEMDVGDVRRYLYSHKRTFQIFSGETLIQRTLSRWYGKEI